MSSDLVMLILRHQLLQVRARICFFSACPGSSVQDYCKIIAGTIYTIYYGAFKSLLSTIHMHRYYVHVHINMHTNIKIF